MIEQAIGKNYSMTFFGKVMSFFTLAIISSLAGTFITYKFLLMYFILHPWLMWACFIAELVLVFTSRIWSKKTPLNKLLFALFTFLTGMTLAPLVALVAASPGGVTIIMKALLATGFTFTAAAIFGWTTKFNLAGLRGFLLIGLLGMIIVGVIGIFLPWDSTTEMIYSGIGVLLFTGYTMYDFQKLKAYPENMYIEAALQLYLDIFNLFIFILRLISSGRR